MPEPLAIQHLTHDHGGRFETHVDGLRCEADYVRQGHTVTFTHTGVPAALQGRGIAAQLVAAALDWARAEGVKVVPACSYVRVYMQRHRDTQDLLQR